jgi:hypothetical protein
LVVDSLAPRDVHQIRWTTSWIAEINVTSSSAIPTPPTRLREEAQVPSIPAIGTWAVSSFELCKAIVNGTDSFAGDPSRSYGPCLEYRPPQAVDGNYWTTMSIGLRRQELTEAG